MLKNKFIILLFITILVNPCFADEALPTPTQPAQTSSDDATNIQKIIAEYKSYLSTVSAKVRDEIVNFRKTIADLNKQKRQKYQALSPEAQNYLKNEQLYKKRLPVSNKALINLTN